MLDELRWYFEQVRAHPTPSRSDDLDERFYRAGDAFSAPRFKALYKVWKPDGEPALAGAGSRAISDAVDAGAYAEKKREWFVAHARGASFRSLHLPIEMTRKMEHIFLTSRDHLTIEQAIRRAELRALGASEELVQAVQATGSATDLRNGAFWRTVWMFLIANASAIDLAQVGPMLDFVQAIRHERVAVETPDGIVLRDPSATAVVFGEGTNSAIHAAVDAGLASESWLGERRPHLGTITTATDDDRGTLSRPVGATERVAADGAHERCAAQDRRHCSASLRGQLC